jgi:N-methylhydantoinase A/oxoprolinase/acetone carboxylase beta subunit
MRIGIDAGGTFTDFAILDRGGLSSFKLRSNPQDPASVILEGIARAAGQRTPSEVIHGSTVATNALLERKGARTALVTTAGFEDVLAIGRQNRRELYNLTPRPSEPLIPRERCFGAQERTLAGGAIEIEPQQLEALRRRLTRANVESIAICLLHSFVNPANEQAVAAALDGIADLTLSSEICPEFREYERASTTAVNAYVAPMMKRYLSRLAAGISCPLWIMQSNGGLLEAAEAGRQAVRTILSGPAGGVAGAFDMARRAGFPRVIGFDMGGTSTDVSLADGAREETHEAYIDGLPVRVPMLDIVTVGAGGGSIARIDPGGLLRVGPESAGAFPGPACYGEGDRPTVTDAHVTLGRIRSLLGGEIPLDSGRARAAVETLGLGAKQGAEGILHVANANMEQAIRAITVERGRDPRDFALLAFGGCGGLHACELADQLGIRHVLSPRFAGILSAYGMLISDRVRDAARGVLGLDPHDLEAVFEQLEESLPGPGRIERFADLRYAGQSYELTVPWKGGPRRFEQLHQRLYGYRMASPVEVVTLRVRRTSRAANVRLPAAAAIAGRGPELIAEYGSTLWIPRGWRYRTGDSGVLILSR